MTEDVREDVREDVIDIRTLRFSVSPADSDVPRFEYEAGGKVYRGMITHDDLSKLSLNAAMCRRMSERSLTEKESMERRIGNREFHPDDAQLIETCTMPKLFHNRINKLISLLVKKEKERFEREGAAARAYYEEAELYDRIGVLGHCVKIVDQRVIVRMRK